MPLGSRLSAAYANLCPVCSNPVSQRPDADVVTIGGQRVHASCDTPESRLLSAIFGSREPTARRRIAADIGGEVTGHITSLERVRVERKQVLWRWRCSCGLLGSTGFHKSDLQEAARSHKRQCAIDQADW